MSFTTKPELSLDEQLVIPNRYCSLQTYSYNILSSTRLSKEAQKNIVIRSKFLLDEYHEYLRSNKIKGIEKELLNWFLKYECTIASYVKIGTLNRFFHLYGQEHPNVEQLLFLDKEELVWILDYFGFEQLEQDIVKLLSTKNYPHETLLFSCSYWNKRKLDTIYNNTYKSDLKPAIQFTLYNLCCFALNTNLSVLKTIATGNNIQFGVLNPQIIEHKWRANTSYLQGKALWKFLRKQNFQQVYQRIRYTRIKQTIYCAYCLQLALTDNVKAPCCGGLAHKACQEKLSKLYFCLRCGYQNELSPSDNRDLAILDYQLNNRAFEVQRSLENIIDHEAKVKASQH